MWWAKHDGPGRPAILGCLDGRRPAPVVPIPMLPDHATIATVDALATTYAMVPTVSDLEFYIFMKVWNNSGNYGKNIIICLCCDQIKEV